MLGWSMAEIVHRAAKVPSYALPTGANFGLSVLVGEGYDMTGKEARVRVFPVGKQKGWEISSGDEDSEIIIDGQTITVDAAPTSIGTVGTSRTLRAMQFAGECGWALDVLDGETLAFRIQGDISFLARTGAIEGEFGNFPEIAVSVNVDETIEVMLQIAVIEGGGGGGDVAGDTHAAASKTTPVDADEMPLADSAATFALKKLTWANLKATLKTYFDTLYQTIIGTGDIDNAKLDNMAAGTTKGRAVGSGTGAPVDLTASEMRTILNVADGATAFNPAIPGAIGSTTPAAGTFTTVTATGAGAFSVPAIGFATTAGLFVHDNNLVFKFTNTTNMILRHADGLHIRNTFGAGKITWGGVNDNNAIGTITNGLEPIATNIMSVKNGSAAQSFRVYGDGTKYAQIEHNGTDSILSSSSGKMRVTGLCLDELTVGTLPTASTNARARYEVTDASAPSVGATVAGGGSAKCTVRSNGTNWIVLELL
jgi:hypothetical protein